MKHQRKQNNIGIAFLGEFSKSPLSSAQFSAGNKLVISLANHYGIQFHNIKTHGEYNREKSIDLAGAAKQIQSIKFNVHCLTSYCTGP